MLRFLKIENLAIAQSLEVQFGPGLNILTGETGAGKSILVEAISLLAGFKADSSMVREGSEKASVEGLIEVVPNGALDRFLKEHDIEHNEGELLIRRTISNDSKSKAWLNTVSFTVSGLQELSVHWLDISSQHAFSRLLSVKNHMLLLDVFIQNMALIQTYQTELKAYQNKLEAFQKMRSDNDRFFQNRSFYEFLLSELEQAKLINEHEEDELKSQLKNHSMLEKTAQLFKNIKEWCESDEGLFTILHRIDKELSQAKVLHENESDLIPRWQQAKEELLDVLKKMLNMQNQSNHMDLDIDALNERIMVLQKISRKHGSVKKAMELKDQLSHSLSEQGGFEIDLKKVEVELKQSGQKMKEAAKALQENRKKAALAFERDVSKEFASLGMQKARLRVSITDLQEGGIEFEQERFNSNGMDVVEFEFSPNVGEGFKPLKTIASGGELSRVFLSIKSVGLKSNKEKQMSYLFDEVDIGVGGKTAEQIGLTLKNFAKGQQVLCVTHLPQVACYGDVHLKVKKEIRSNRTQIQIESLNIKQREAELARMIDGIEVSETALMHAKTLLNKNKNLSTQL